LISDFNFCHRTFVARAAARLSRMQVTHLTDQKAISDQREYRHKIVDWEAGALYISFGRRRN
jgi:hypothetical protein